ncbi:hypothetical protein N185_16525 [Sinorhizobium sp. GW3]|nr:hypothetical protein N185_16525 [Sinorhizobium sp. GW3]
MRYRERVLKRLAGGDLLRSRDFVMARIPRIVLQCMLADGEVEQPQRGLYRIPGIETDPTEMKTAEIANAAIDTSKTAKEASAIAMGPPYASTTNDALPNKTTAPRKPKFARVMSKIVLSIEPSFSSSWTNDL